jgi:hypothetical protein
MSLIKHHVINTNWEWRNGSTHCNPLCYKDLNCQIRARSASTPGEGTYSTGCVGRLRLKCDGTRAETRFRLSAQRTSPFKPAGESVQSTTGRRAVHISLQGLYCSCKPVFCSYVTLTGYPLHSPVSPLLLFPCVTVCHHISKAVYLDVPQNRSGCGRGEEFVFFAWNRSLIHRLCSPKFSHCSDWAIPAP